MTRRIVLLLTFSLALALWARRRTKLEELEAALRETFLAVLDRYDYEHPQPLGAVIDSIEEIWERHDILRDLDPRTRPTAMAMARAFLEGSASHPNLQDAPRTEST